MKLLTIPTLREDKIPLALSILEERNLIKTKKCFVCEKHVTKNNLSGFMPHNGKVVLICNDPECYLKSVSKRRKINGNGSI